MNGSVETYPKKESTDFSGLAVETKCQTTPCKKMHTTHLANLVMKTGLIKRIIVCLITRQRQSTKRMRMTIGLFLETGYHTTIVTLAQVQYILTKTEDVPNPGVSVTTFNAFTNWSLIAVLF